VAASCGAKSANFIEPTLIVPRSNDSEVVQNEVFGPVLTFQTFKTEEEGVALANSTAYGLSGIVYTGDAARAEACGPRGARGHGLGQHLPGA
jgi:betaine-aldehyde dehydrogenase/5-carboxymethyl-2-hydroxymuconic-semialdehyde dehydrogenase